jgi:Na+/proline symporter
VVFPELSDIQRAFPSVSADKLGDDIAYPAMLTLLPTGLLGLVAASLMAAFMSTMSTQLNLGASYLVNDFYKRFVRPDASEKKLVWVARMFTVLSMVIGCILGLTLNSAGQAFNLLLLLGAGTGLMYILRWFWWRINAYTEIAAMISSMVIAGYFSFFHDKMGFLPMEDWQKMVIGVVLTTLVWIIASYVTPPTDEKTLRNFVRLIKPDGPGWNDVIQRAHLDGEELRTEKGQLPNEILGVVVGSVTVYATLMASGFWIYSETVPAVILTVVAIAGGFYLKKILSNIRFE